MSTSTTPKAHEDVPTSEAEDPPPVDDATERHTLLVQLRRAARVAHLTGKRVLGLLTLGVTLAGVYHFYTPLVTGPPPKSVMTGDLNVAIAGLASARGTPREDAEALSDSLYRAINDEVRSLGAGSERLDIQVAGPAEVGTIDDESAVGRLATAQRLDRELRADVLVYGTLRRAGDAIEVQPEFLFAPRHVAHPEDREPMLTAVTLPPAPSGREPLGTIRETGAAAAAIVARARLRARLVGRARAFALFIVGLGHYTDALTRMAGGDRASRQLATADELMQDAARSGHWDPRVGHVLHLFLGNVSLMRHAYGKAERQYRIALRFRRDYDRAQFGVAEARFHRSAGGDCSPTAADPDGLKRSMLGYRAVLERVGSAPSLLRSKAQFGMGRAAFCASYAGFAQSWSQAEQAFDAVLADAGAATASKAQVAGAHAGLGLVVLARGDTGRRRLMNAASHFEQAIASTPVGPQQGALWSFLARTRAELGERRAARKAYTKAMRLDPAHRDGYRAEVDDVLGR